MQRPTGVILYRGPSQLNGLPVVAVATLRPSKNPKTGLMIPVYILPDTDSKPHEHFWRRDEYARAMCGDCVHLGRSCYVRWAQAPGSIWDGLRRGIYPTFNPGLHLHHFAGQRVRFGAAGDPAAVPYPIWGALSRVAAGHTAYTHAWRYCDQRLRRVAMASCDRPADVLKARALGWRTYRARLPEEGLLPGEFACPASAEAGFKRDCASCLACDGATDSPDAHSPAIVFHGPDNAVGMAMLARYRAVSTTGRPTTPKGLQSLGLIVRR
jgi:hypothetical protein